MGKTTTTKKPVLKRAAKPAAVKAEIPAEPRTAEVKAAPKAKRVRKTVEPKATKPVTAKRTTTAAKTSRKSGSKASKPAYSSDEIALRAYFIAQKRQQLGQHGSPESDWLEAERQLREGLSV